MKLPEPFCGRLLQQSEMADSTEMCHLFCMTFWLCFPNAVTDCYGNHTLVAYMTITLKATDV